VAVKENLKVKGHELDERQSNAFGMIHLAGSESIFAIDGQHRVEGIRAAVLKDPKLLDEEQAVIFVAHLTTDDGRKQTRRLFATLNTYAQRITDREKVAISEDDSFAIATRQLIEEYPGLGMDFVPLLSTPNIPAHEKTCITTVVGLFQMTEWLAPPEIRRKTKRFHDGPSDEESVAAIYDATANFWTALKKHIPQIRAVCSSKPAEQLAAKYRHADGGHLLFRPVGMKAFAKATRTLMDRGNSADAAVAKLAKVSLDVADELWREVLWRPESRTMLNKYGRLAQNIFLQRVGEAPESKKYSVSTEYQRITGRAYPKKPK
jgi:DNA sulfur modification protein DndB